MSVPKYCKISSSIVLLSVLADLWTLFWSIYMLYYSALGGQLVRAVCIFYATLYSVIHHLTYKLLMWIHNCAFLADHDSFSSGTSAMLFNQLCNLLSYWQARTKDERCSLQHYLQSEYRVLQSLAWKIGTSLCIQTTHCTCSPSPQ